MNFKVLALVFLSATLIFCKKEAKKNEVIKTASNRVFTNITDPRLAEIVTEDNRSITFYGSKDVNGKPTSLLAYRIKSLTDSNKADVFTFDEAGRYSDVVFANGSKVHFDFSKNNDSVFVATSTGQAIDTVIGLKYVRKPKGQRLVNANRIVGTGDVNIKVVARDPSDPSIQEVNVAGAQVTVRMIGNKFDYLLLAKYDGNGIYSVPIPSNLQSSSPTITRDVADFIINSLNIACFSSCDGCPSFASTLAPFCIRASTVPYLGPLCTIATSSLIFLCDMAGDKIIEKLLNKIVAYNSSNNIPDEAAVIITSEHFQYGQGSTPGMTMSEIRRAIALGEPYVAKIDYVERSVVGEWNLTFTWNGTGANTTPIRFSADQSLLIPVFGTTGKWYIKKSNITFILSNGNQYKGMWISRNSMNGSMKGGTNTGVWSASR